MIPSARAVCSKSSLVLPHELTFWLVLGVILSVSKDLDSNRQKLSVRPRRAVSNLLSTGKIYFIAEMPPSSRPIMGQSVGQKEVL